MNLIFARIDLSKSNYKELSNYKVLDMDSTMIELCNNIYKSYCKHKQFDSVVPIFDSMYLDPKTDVLGYYDVNKLVAFSIVKKWDTKNAESLQFAWDYKNPKLRFGIESLKNECAKYKRQGFNYLYLGLADDYKSSIDGYEIVGKYE